MPVEAPSLRDTLESAMNASAEEAPEVVAAPEAEVAPVEAQHEETAAEAAQRARDEKGRFAPKAAEAKPAEKPQAVKPAEPVKAAPVEAKPLEPKPEVRAEPVKTPQSFKAATRELAQKLPAEFRPILEDAIRIDNEAKRALNDSAEARKTVEAVRSTLQPYEAIARANGMDAMQYAGSVLQSAAVLQMGSPQQKAALVAGLIKQYGISPDDVNPFLSGEAQPPRQMAPQPAAPTVDPREQVRAILEEERNRQVIEEFLGSKPEFLDDVMDDMTLLLRADRAKGGNMTPQQAYDRACKMNEDVSSVLAQRKAAEALRAQAPTVQRAKVAGASIKPSPAATATRPAGPTSLRETIEAAVAGQRT